MKYRVIVEARYLIEVVVEAENEEAAQEHPDLLPLYEDTPWYVEIAGRTWHLPDGEPPQAIIVFEEES